MIKGILAILGASILYGIVPTISTALLQSGMDSQSIVIYRFSISSIASLLICLCFKISLKVSKKQFVELLLFGIFGYGMTAMFLSLSYNLLPGGLAQMVHFSYPLFVIIIMVIMFKEKLTMATALSVILIVAGLFLLADIKSGFSTIGLIYATLSGLTYGVYVVSNKKSSFSNLNSFTALFYIMTFSTVFFLLTNKINVMPNALASNQIVYILLLALFCTVMALSLLIVGIKLLGATKASVLNMVEPVVSILAGFAIFSEELTLQSIIGSFLIVLSVTIMAIFANNNKTAKKSIKNNIS